MDTFNRIKLFIEQNGMPYLNHKERTNKARKELGFEPLADSLFINYKK